MLKKFWQGKLIVGVSCLMLLVNPGLGFAAEGINASEESAIQNVAEEGLTLDEAVEKALKRSYALKAADFDIERAAQTREDSANKLKYVPTTSINPVALNLYNSWFSASISYEMAKKSKDITADGIVYSVLESYLNISTAQEQIRLAEKALELAAWQRNAAQAGLRAGVTSKSEAKSAEDTYQEKAESLALARLGLENNFEKLNGLIGLPLDERPKLVDEPVFTSLEVANLDTFIVSKVEDSPTNYQLDKNVELAEIQNESTGLSVQTYRANAANVDKAKETAANSREQMHQAMRSLYHSIKQGEEQYHLAQTGLKQAQDKLEVKNVEYAAGTITQIAVLTAEMEVASQEQQLKSLVNQLEVSKYAFQNPWVIF